MMAGSLISACTETRGRVVANPQFGYFVDAPMDTLPPANVWPEQMHFAHDLHNASGALSPACRASFNASDAWKCLLAPHAAALRSVAAVQAANTLCVVLYHCLLSVPRHYTLAVGSKIVAKERIAPFRKDVLIKSGKLVGGGDITRKQKLLKKQKEGKKRMKTIGNVELSQAAFLSIMQR